MATELALAPGLKFSLIPKQNRKKIYAYLFREGVIVVKKDANLAQHQELDVPNLHVMMTLKSLKSRDFVSEQFNWQHNYYSLKNDGIEYLREYLHLPEGVFPSTLTRQAKSRRDPDFGGGGGGAGREGGGRGVGRGRGFGGGERGGWGRD